MKNPYLWIWDGILSQRRLLRNSTRVAILSRAAVAQVAALIQTVAVEVFCKIFLWGILAKISVKILWIGFANISQSVRTHEPWSCGICLVLACFSASFICAFLTLLFQRLFFVLSKVIDFSFNLFAVLSGWMMGKWRFVWPSFSFCFRLIHNTPP